MLFTPYYIYYIAYNTSVYIYIYIYKFEHIGGTLRNLHWLRIPERIVYTVASIARKCLYGMGPEYLKDYLVPVSSLIERSHLRSADKGVLATPRTRTKKVGERSFRYSGPSVWNSLPSSIRSDDVTSDRFMSDLKTFLFI